MKRFPVLHARRVAMFIAVPAVLLGAFPASTPAFAADAPRELPTIYKTAPVPDLDTIPRAGKARNFHLIAHTDLGRSGADNNGNSLAFKDDCIYIGHRGDEAGLVVLDVYTLDIINELPRNLGSNTQEHRVIADLNLLVTMGFGSASSGVNIIQVWDIADCRYPVLRSTMDFGAVSPHEFFLWRDPKEPTRALVYLTLPNGPSQLRVIDVTDKRAPTVIATWDLTEFGVPRNEPASAANQFIAQGNSLHSISVRDDGGRVWLAQMDAGFLILDSERIATKTPCDAAHFGTDPCLRLVNPDVNARLDPTPPGPGKTHSAVKIPGKDVIILTHEVLGSGSCPWHWARFVDIRYELMPKQMSTFMLPENLEENCKTVGAIAIATGSDFTAHNPTPLKNVLFITWRGAGLRAVDISNPYTPHEIGYYFPQPVVGADGKRVRIHTVSYPVIKDGMIYVLDRFNGLYVLQYTGPYREEVDTIKGPCMGNASPNQDVGMLDGYCVAGRLKSTARKPVRLN